MFPQICCKTSFPHFHFHLYIFILCPLSPHLLSSPCPSIHLISYLSPSNLRDGLENVLWHFLHHLGPISSSSARTPRPLCSILFTHTTTKRYPAGSALSLCLLIASLYTCSPSSTSQNLPAQCRIRYRSTDIPHPVWSLVSLCSDSFGRLVIF